MWAHTGGILSRDDVAIECKCRSNANGSYVPGVRKSRLWSNTQSATALVHSLAITEERGTVATKLLSASRRPKDKPYSIPPTTNQQARSSSTTRHLGYPRSLSTREFPSVRCHPHRPVLSALSGGVSVRLIMAPAQKSKGPAGKGAAKGKKPASAGKKVDDDREDALQAVVWALYLSRDCKIRN